jgi:secreted trypsin-like serine protease
MMTGTSSTFLQYVDVPAVPNERCKTIYQRQATIVPSQVCAGGASQDSCDGDSGGPLTVNALLLIIIIKKRMYHKT